MGCSSIHVEDITFREWRFCAGSEVHLDLGKIGEIVAGTLREGWINLVGIDDASFSHKLRKQSCVVTSACAYVDNPFAFPGSKGSNAERVQRGLSIVHWAIAAKRDDDILIENGRVVGRGSDIAKGCEYLPRRRP